MADLGLAFGNVGNVTDWAGPILSSLTHPCLCCTCTKQLSPRRCVCRTHVMMRWPSGSAVGTRVCCARHVAHFVGTAGRDNANCMWALSYRDRQGACDKPLPSASSCGCCLNVMYTLPTLAHCALSVVAAFTCLVRALVGALSSVTTTMPHPPLHVSLSEPFSFGGMYPSLSKYGDCDITGTYLSALRPVIR